MDNVKSILMAFNSLKVYRSILDDQVIRKLYEVISYTHYNRLNGIESMKKYNEFYSKLLEKGKGCSLKEYIILEIISNENIYSNKVQKKDKDPVQDYIIDIVKTDLRLLNEIANIKLPETSGKQEIYNDKHKDIISMFMEGDDWEDKLDVISDFYKSNGAGIWGQYKGFVWEGEKLQGVSSLDPIKMSDMIGYETPRQKVIDNTLAFLNGYPANNILLYGSRGTGKSSTVKAILNEYHHKGLRIIEISKKHLETFPNIIREIKDYPQKFILFIDDLAFDDGDTTYTSLKAVLEGGLETRPDNIIIYATSNRKHLIKEKFSDRRGIMSSDIDDEVRAIDTMEEKLSLSDRFGMTVTFTSPDQNQYLEIVEGLVSQREIVIDKEELRKKALQWEMWYNAKSPRTATQFVDWLESQKKY